MKQKWIQDDGLWAVCLAAYLAAFLGFSDDPRAPFWEAGLSNKMKQDLENGKTRDEIRQEYCESLLNQDPPETCP